MWDVALPRAATVISLRASRRVTALISSLVNFFKIASLSFHLLDKY